MWEALTSIEQFEREVGESRANNSAFILFKHSTRCSISSMAKSRMERSTFAGVPVFLVSLIEHRQLSNYIADTLGVEHQSPQAIVVKNGIAVFDESHTAIDANELVKQAS